VHERALVVGGVDEQSVAPRQHAHVAGLDRRAQVYVVRTVEGNAFKLEIVDYYDEAGTGGLFTIRWAAVTAE
jgi:hypothetical protein